jgi:hypothetical protein
VRTIADSVISGGEQGATSSRGRAVMGESMRKALRISGWTLLALLLIGGYAAWRIVWGHPFTINQLANRQAAFLLMRNPELFTAVGIADGTIVDRHSGKLAPVGTQKRDADYAFFHRALEDVRRFERASLKPQDQITYDILEDFYGSQVAFERFEWMSSEGLYPISPMFGTQISLVGFMQTQHVVKNEKTARNYVARLRAMGDKLDGVTAEMQRQSAAGVVLPPALLEKSLTVIDEVVAPAPAENALVTSFVERMAGAKDLDATTRAELQTQAVAAVTDVVYPAYVRMRTALNAERARAEGTAAGVGPPPGRRRVLPRDVEAVHHHGLHPGAGACARARRGDAHRCGDGCAARRPGPHRRDGRRARRRPADGCALPAAKRRLGTRADARGLPRDARRRHCAHAGVFQHRAARQAPGRARTGVRRKRSVRRLLPGRRTGRLQAGTFFANLRDVHEMPTWGMKTLAYHEGIPGHHFQIATAQGLKGLPMIRQQPIYTAYVEGWALYAERLMAEIGMYEGNPWGDLGRLQAEMYRAVRLVVDTGCTPRAERARQPSNT